MNDMLGRILRLLNKDVNETFDQTTDSLEAIRDWLAAGGSGSPGLCYYGLVTAVPGANQFTCDNLIGLGDDKFLDLAGSPYRAYVLRDAGGAAAAPQGEHRAITDYVSATGTFTTAAFSAAVAVGDEILLIHPFLASLDINTVKMAATTEDLQQAAGNYTLFTGTGQAVVVERLLIRLPNVNVADDAVITSISIQTDDTTAQVFISNIQGAKANLTAEQQLSWRGAIMVAVGTNIQLTINGGAADAPTVCDIVAEYRTVVAGGTLA